MKYKDIKKEIEYAERMVEMELWNKLGEGIFYRKNFINDNSITLVRVNDLYMKTFEVSGFNSCEKDFINEFVNEIKEQEEKNEEYKIEDLPAYMLIDRDRGMLDVEDTKTFNNLIELMSREYVVDENDIRINYKDFDCDREYEDEEDIEEVE